MNFNRIFDNNNHNKIINQDFDYDCDKSNELYLDWYALKHPTNEFGEWSISPKEHFDKHGYIPDGHANLKINGMEEVMDYTYKTLDNSSGVKILKDYGFEILHNPTWYFMK